jgi:hypothetical protein
VLSNSTADTEGWQGEGDTQQAAAPLHETSRGASDLDINVDGECEDSEGPSRPAKLVCRAN